MNTCFDYGCAGCENCVDYESQTMTNTSTTLTDDEIEALSRKYVSVRGKEDNYDFAWLDFARAIEAKVSAADRRLTAEQPVAWHKPGTNLVVHRDVKEDLNGGFEFTQPLYARAPITAEQGGADDGRQQSLWVHDLGGPTETIHDKREAFGENDEWTEFRRAALTTQPQAEPGARRKFSPYSDDDYRQSLTPTAQPQAEPPVADGEWVPVRKSLRHSDEAAVQALLQLENGKISIAEAWRQVTEYFETEKKA